MGGFILKALAAAAGLWVAARLVPGIAYADAGSLIIAAVILGVVNAVIRPIVVILTLPLTIVTFGLFLLVVNALMLGLTAALLEGFTVQGFGAALLGSIVVSVVSWVVSLAIDRTG